MNGAFGQMGAGMPGGPGSMGSPPQLGGPAPQGAPMGDPNLGGQAVFAGPYAAPASAPMGAPQASAYAGPPARALGNPLAQWIPSFSSIMARVDSMARAIPWWLWLLGGAAIVFGWRFRTSVQRWVSKAMAN